MSEEGVEVRFGAEVEDLRIVRVVQMSKHAKKLAVNVFDCRRKVLWEFSA